MKNKNWSKAGLLILVLVVSLFLPYVIRGGFHLAAERIEKISEKQRTETEAESETETEGITEKGASISAREGNESEEKPSEIPVQGLQDDICHEKTPGLTGELISKRMNMYKSTLTEYLKGITQTDCEIRDVTFVEKFDKRDKAYKTEVTFAANGRKYTEKLITEYDSEFDFFRIYPEGLIEE